MRNPTSEEAIERIVERSMNILDKQLMTNSITQEEYDEEVAELERWAMEVSIELKPRMY